MAFQLTLTALFSFTILNVPAENLLSKYTRQSRRKFVLKRFHFLTKLSFQFICRWSNVIPDWQLWLCFNFAQLQQQCRLLTCINAIDIDVSVMLGIYFGSCGDIFVNFVFVAVIQSVSICYVFGWSTRNLFVIVRGLPKDLRWKRDF